MLKQQVLRVFRDPPELRTERLLLRRIRRSDAEDMFSYASDPKTTRFLTWEAHPDLAYTERYLGYLTTRYRAGDFFDWAVVLPQERRMVGTAGFTRFHFDANAAEIGYVLHPSLWGQGYAAEAARAVLDFGFGELRLHRIEAHFMEGNDASRRVMEKCGMRYEGMAREVLFLRGRYVSVGTCALLSRDYFGEIKN